MYVRVSPILQERNGFWVSTTFTQSIVRSNFQLLFFPIISKFSFIVNYIFEVEFLGQSNSDRPNPSLSPSKVNLFMNGVTRIAGPKLRICATISSGSCQIR